MVFKYKACASPDVYLSICNASDVIELQVQICKLLSFRLIQYIQYPIEFYKNILTGNR